jgi:hypothetical protein
MGGLDGRVIPSARHFKAPHVSKQGMQRDRGIAILFGPKSRGHRPPGSTWNVIPVQTHLLIATMLGVMIVAPNRIRARTSCSPGMEDHGAGVCGYSQSWSAHDMIAISLPSDAPVTIL